MFNIGELRDAVRGRLPRCVFEFVDRDTGDDLALRTNRAAFERAALRRQMLVDVSKRWQAVDLFGAPSVLPVVVAPLRGVAVHGERGAALALSSLAQDWTGDGLHRLREPGRTRSFPARPCRGLASPVPFNPIHEEVIT
jgi:hypothetical protein